MIEQNGEHWTPPMAQDRLGTKEVPDKVLDKTVIDVPRATGGSPPDLDVSLIWMMGQFADDISPWGTNPKRRDRELAAFYPTEHFLSSALGTVVSRNVAFNWNIAGPSDVVDRYKEMLTNADLGRGMSSLISKTSIDVYTQDSGAFWELVREDNERPDSPVIGVNHLESLRCWHTGDPKMPVIYQDRKGRYHKLPWWSVAEILEMPAPRERWPGIQLCAVTRLLRASQIMRNISIYQEEKTGGRHARAIHLIRGLTSAQIQDALAKMQGALDQKGLLRYVQPLIVGSVDPKAEIGHDTLELSSLPDGFDEEKVIRNYITVIAMAFLSDYQEFAPLPGGNLGTSAQSEVMHMKSRGKGPALWQKLISTTINNLILPKGVEFFFDEQDTEADKQEEDVKKVRADRFAVYVTGGIMGAQAATIALVEAGDISGDLYDNVIAKEFEEAAKNSEPVVEEAAEGKPLVKPPPGDATRKKPKQTIPRKKTTVLPDREGASQGGSKEGDAGREENDALAPLPFGQANGATATSSKHLPGRHNQKTHGRRGRTVVFHGTTDEAAKRIVAEGLKPGGQFGIKSIHEHISQSGTLYLSSDRNRAENWAFQAARNVGSRTTVYKSPGVVVVKVSLPKSMSNRLKQDKNVRGDPTSFQFRGKIPLKFIVGIETYDSSTGNWVAGEKATAARVYYIPFLVPPPNKKSAIKEALAVLTGAKHLPGRHNQKTHGRRGVRRPVEAGDSVFPSVTSHPGFAKGSGMATVTGSQAVESWAQTGEFRDMRDGAYQVINNGKVDHGDRYQELGAMAMYKVNKAPIVTNLKRGMTVGGTTRQVMDRMDLKEGGVYSLELGGSTKAPHIAEGFADPRPHRDGSRPTQQVMFTITRAKAWNIGGYYINTSQKGMKEYITGGDFKITKVSVGKTKIASKGFTPYLGPHGPPHPKDGRIEITMEQVVYD